MFKRIKKHYFIIFLAIFLSGCGLKKNVFYDDRDDSKNLPNDIKVEDSSSISTANTEPSLARSNV